MIIESLDTDKETIVVAEIGNNHEGSYDLAEELIGRAAQAGAQAVKFQTIVPERFVRPQDFKRLNQLKKFELSLQQFEKLKKTADREEIVFFSTPFDLETVAALDPLMPVFKIASGDNNFYPLLKAVAKTGKPVILSTGFADIDQIRKSTDCIEEEWRHTSKKGSLALLHCVSSYPVNPHEANLKAIGTLQKAFPAYTIGYSDHTVGIQAAVVAVALGARIIEKHFTIDKNYSDFRDHALSADPVDLKELVIRIKEVEAMLGTEQKIIQEGEKKNAEAMRRSIVAASDLPEKSVVEEKHITWMRPGDGLPPGRENEVIGKTLQSPIKMGEAFIMTRWKIVSASDLSGAPEAVSLLEEAGTLVQVGKDLSALYREIGDCDAYLCNCEFRVDRELIDRATRLKLIGSPHTGKDHLDLKTIESRKITLFHIADELELIRSFTATSELAFTLLLALNRRLCPALDDAKRGIWAREAYTGMQLYGKTLGIVGLGRLGTISARIGNGFGMRVIACDPQKKEVADVTMVDFDTLLHESDIITLHIHLTKENEGFIEAQAFEKMKQGAILINTSRGRVVDEQALLEALQSGKLGGAGLDVIDGEWLTREDLAGHPLVKYTREHDNLLISPHIGGATKESIYGARVFMARKIADYIKNHAA